MNHTPVVKKYNLGRHRKHHKLQSKRLSEYKSFKIIFVVIYINKKKQFIETTSSILLTIFDISDT